MAARRGSDVSLPHFIEHDWRDMAMRDAVAEKVMAQAGFDVLLDTDDRANIRHARTLQIEGTGGAIEILLDQGLGHWRAAERVRFDFTTRMEDQARKLLELRFRVAGAANSQTEIFIGRSG